MSLRIDLYFDMISPYANFAWIILQRYKKAWNMDLRLIPVFLGAIMNGAGNQPPAMVPARGAFLQKDLSRNKDFLGVPNMLCMHGNFFDIASRSILFQRAIAATIAVAPECATEVVTSFSNAIYFDERQEGNTIDVTDDWIRKNVARAVKSDDKTKLIMEKSKSEEIKGKVKQNTADALALGAYGVPMMMISTQDKPPEFFFGSDRFEQIAHLYGKKWCGPCGPQESKL